MSSPNEVSVIKRDGRKELLNISKVNKMTFEACEGLTGVSSSQIEMNSGLQFFDGVTTDEVQEILIKSAADLISLETPNYQFAAGRLLLFALRKKALGKFQYTHLQSVIDRNVELGLYDPQILEMYDTDEIDKDKSMTS